MNVFFNEVYVNDWLLTFPKWAGIAIVVALLFLAIFPLFQGKRFRRLERATCKEGGEAISLGPSAPYWIALLAAICSAVRVFFRLLAIREMGDAFHCGIDLSKSVEYTFPFGVTLPIPLELAQSLELFAALWYVPFAAGILSTLLRLGIFRSPGAGFRYLVVQLLAANAMYWIYGTYMAFIVMPVAAILLFVVGYLLFGGAGRKAGDDGQRRREAEEERRREEEEYDKDHKVLDDGSWGGREITRHWDGWSDGDGNHYRENGDGSFTREN